jgi:hypothetical protein
LFGIAAPVRSFASVLLGKAQAWATPLIVETSGSSIPTSPSTSRDEMAQTASRRWNTGPRREAPASSYDEDEIFLVLEGEVSYRVGDPERLGAALAGRSFFIVEHQM